MKSIAVAVLLGCCGVLCLAELPGMRSLILFAAVAAVALRLRHKALAAACCGLIAATIAGRLAVHDRLDAALESQNIAFTGVVDSIPERTGGGGLKFAVAVDRAGPRLPARVELGWYEPEFSPRPAERLAFVARLRAPRGFANPGGSDREAQLLREGVGATGYVRDLKRVENAAAPTWHRAPVLALRAEIAARIHAALGERPATGIAQGLAVGLQDALSKEQWQALSRSGTSHLMAISGLHIGMLAALGAAAGMLLGRLRLRLGAQAVARDHAVFGAILVTLAYSALAGWSVPTQRTAIMITIGAMALRARRASSAGDVLALSLLAVLAIDPLAPLAPGFWLSFGAVCAILLAVGGEFAQAGALAGFWRTQLAVTIGLVPVLALCFGNVSLVSAGVNLVAVPLYTLVIVPGVLLGTALGFAVPEAGAMVLRAVADLIEFSWPLIAVPAAWQWSTWPLASQTPPMFVLLAVGAVASMLPLPLHARLAGVGIVLAVCLSRPAPLPPGHARITLLDVGQGLAVVVETRQHALLYDAGPAFRSGGDAGALAIVPFLAHRGIRRLDRLVISHDDLDHLGGARSVLGAVAVAEVVSSRPLRGIRSGACRVGETWNWDGLRFEFLHPGADAPPGDNDASCVLQIASAGTGLLLTGDIEAEAESQLVERGELSRVEVVVAPHHGSRTSSSAGFVGLTRPRWVLYSAGYRNRWGFPAREVAQRWRDAGAEALSTAESGAIELWLGPDSLEPPRQYRQLRRRWWHAEHD